VVDSHPGCRGGAEHGDRLTFGGGVEVAALSERGADGVGQVEAACLHRERVGVDLGDVRAAVGVDVVDGAGFLDGGDRADPGDHPWCGGGELGGFAGQGLSVDDGEQVGAQRIDLAQ
jgi:hypothetical protein